MVVNMDQSYTSYIGLHFWGLSTETMSLMPLASLAGGLLALVAVRPLTELLDKRNLLIFTTVLAIFNLNAFIVSRLLFPDLFPTNDSSAIPVLVGINYFVVGVVGVTILTTINSIYADLADEHELITGNRREATLYATRSFANKGAAAIGVTLSGVALELISFPAAAKVGSVSEDTIRNLGLLYGPIVSSALILSVYLFTRYKINRASHQSIRAKIAEKQSSVSDRMTTK